MKLRYKFFSVILGTSFLIIVLLISIFQFFIYSNFQQFLSRTELDKLHMLEKVLEDEYLSSNGWSGLKNNQEYWNEILSYNLPPDMKREIKRPFIRPLKRNGERRLPPHGWERKQGGNFNFRRQPPPPPPEFHPGPVIKEGYRLCLLDNNKIPVAGRYIPGTEYALKEINAQGERAGWLGLGIVTETSYPLSFGFLIKQRNILIMLGAGVLILAAIVSYGLSKHLLSPVNELIKGTRSMKRFDFDTKIDVKTGDEMGDLADHFNEMADRIKSYEEMRKQWLSDISHELRTPVSLLLSKLEAYQDGVRELGPDSVDFLHKDVKRLDRLIRDLYLISKSESGNLVTEKHKLSPVEIISETIASFSIKLESSGIDLDFDSNENRNLYIKADHDQLGRLFSNLVENTIKYTDSPGRLKIQSQRDGRYIIISFEDSSPSVPPDSMGKIFNRLYRVDKSRSRALGGSGLGLSICRQITENHGGKIIADYSDLGGVNISITLPLSG